MDVSPALQALWDQQRRQITDNIRRYGVHLTYVSDHLTCRQGTPCVSCRVGGLDGEREDAIAELFRSMGGPMDLLPPRLDGPFGYTTGLFGIGHAELVVPGLDQDTTAKILNGVAHRVCGHGEDFMPGQVLQMAGRDLLVEEVPNSGMIFYEVHDYYQRPPWEPVEAYQLTWADARGRFPWDEGHDPGRWGQPRPGEYRA